MQPFIFATTAQIICESGAASRLASLCQERGARSVYIVTDPGITRLNMLDDVLPGFAEAGLQVAVFDQVVADPPEAVVLDAVSQARAAQADLVIGFGGGSSMDVAKLVALLAHPACAQELKDIYGVGNARGQRLPLIQVPTTAGTGSEVTQIAIITTGATTKMGVVSPLLLPDVALLDADLTLGLPPAVHALAYPLGGNFHIPHGLSNALVLPHVLRFNLGAARAHYAELAPLVLGERLRSEDPASYADQLIEEVSQLSARMGLPSTLSEAGVPRDMLPQLAAEAMLQQRLLVNNPREVSEADALAIYQAAY
jgi:alcohol dehydrogenase class IV